MRIPITFALALAALVLLGQSAAAQPPEQKVRLLEKKVLSLEAARKRVAAAIVEAERNPWRGVVAVVDDGGWLIVLERMDHAAMTASVELAAGKRVWRRSSRSRARRWRRRSTAVASRP